MNDKLKAALNKKLGIDKSAAKDGKWIPLGNNGVELLCRPASMFNREFQKKMFDNRDKIKLSEMILNTDIAENPEVQAAFAEALLGTVILDIRCEGLTKEEAGGIETIEDIMYLMQEFGEYFGQLIIKLMQRETFAVITEDEEKNS